MSSVVHWTEDSDRVWEPTLACTNARATLAQRAVGDAVTVYDEQIVTCPECKSFLLAQLDVDKVPTLWMET